MPGQTKTGQGWRTGLGGRSGQANWRRDWVRSGGGLGTRRKATCSSRGSGRLRGLCKRRVRKGTEQQPHPFGHSWKGGGGCRGGHMHADWRAVTYADVGRDRVRYGTSWVNAACQRKPGKHSTSQHSSSTAAPRHGIRYSAEECPPGQRFRSCPPHGRGGKRKVQGQACGRLARYIRTGRPRGGFQGGAGRLGSGMHQQ